MAERLMELSWPADSRLRLLLTGGDALHSRPPAALPFRLINNYGPTENTVVTTAGEVVALAPAHRQERAPAIGRPIHNVRVYLLDADLRSVPIGARGELFLAGSSLAQGYLARPGRTAASFMPDPFAALGERMYRTGDLARFLPDGSLEFLGRRDSQIKLRGFRIEPGEIEAALCRHPEVQACVAVAQAESAAPDKRLVAFLVGRSIAMAENDDLRSFLADKLPRYMIPAIFVWVDALPLTPSGKVDRLALAKVRVEAIGHPPNQVSPATALERLFARIWGDVLGCDEVGIDDDFFALGGHSLKAMQVVSMLRDIFQLDVPPDLVFLAPTISRLTAELFPDEHDQLLAERVAQITLDQALRATRTAG